MWQAYVDSREYFAGDRTLEDYQSKVYRFIEWLNKYDKSRKNMKDVTEEAAKSFSLFLLKNYSGNTHNKYIVLLTQIFDVLANEAQTDSNPFAAVRKIPSRKIRAQTNSKRMLTLEELRTVVGKSDGDLKILFCIGTYKVFVSEIARLYGGQKLILSEN